ncbi:unnamed protein product [Trifolium pratense]|uniref:Uncharacterized protein n=1 Tax=Trifolium pratense TaxID=57577 RepID=A0ACB0LLN0_TRIPR|nr:unnamed protein product [Trifolium pratense]
MSNLPDIAEALADFLNAKARDGVANGDDADNYIEPAKDMNHRYDKTHPDIRPYSMMTRTEYMEYNPMKTLYWRGFCQNALPNEETQLRLIDWLGNTWNHCDLKFDNAPYINCKISGQWGDVCKVHNLAKDVVVKFGVTEASNNRTPFTLSSPLSLVLELPSMLLPHPATGRSSTKASTITCSRFPKLLLELFM